MRSPEFWWKRTNKITSLLNFIPNKIVNLKNCAGSAVFIAYNKPLSFSVSCLPSKIIKI